MPRLDEDSGGKGGNTSVEDTAASPLVIVEFVVRGVLLPVPVASSGCIVVGVLENILSMLAA